MQQPKTRREKEIWEACDALYAQSGASETITGELIFTQLIALGFKKGSPNEIYRYRKTWKAARGLMKKEQMIQQRQLTPHDPIARAVQMVRDELIAQANQSLDELKTAYEQKLFQLETEHNNIKTECLGFIDKNDQLEKERALYKIQAESLAEENKRLITDLAQVQVQLQLTQQHNLAQKTQYETACAELKTHFQTVAQKQDQQIAEGFAAWKKDTTDYKDLIERQRHAFIAEIDNLKVKNDVLEKTLAIAIEKECAWNAERERWEALLIARLDDQQRGIDALYSNGKNVHITAKEQSDTLLAIKKQLSEQKDNLELKELIKSIKSAVKPPKRKEAKRGERVL